MSTKGYISVLGFLLIATFSKETHAQELQKVIKHPHTVYWVDASSDGQMIFTAGKDSIGRVFNAQGKLLTELKGHDSSISSILFIEGKELILTGAYDNQAILWNKKGEILHKLQGHSNGVINLAVSEKYKRICTVSRDKTAKIWNYDGELLATLSGHEQQVNTAFFTRDVPNIITAGWDGQIKIWTLDGREIESFDLNSSGIRSITLSPDEKQIVAGHRDGTITVSSRSGKLLKIIEAHKKDSDDEMSMAMINSLSFTSDGKYLYSAGGDYNIMIWDRNYAPIKTFRAHEAYVSGVKIVGDMLVSSSGDNSVKTWRIDNK